MNTNGHESARASAIRFLAWAPRSLAHRSFLGRARRSVARRSLIPALLSIAAFGGSALFSGCSQSSSEPARAPAAAHQPVPVSVVHPHRGPIARSTTLPADVLPFQQALLCAKVAGYLKTITVDKGDRVHEGDLLAEIEVPELLAEQARD